MPKDFTKEEQDALEQMADDNPDQMDEGTMQHMAEYYKASACEGDCPDDKAQWEDGGLEVEGDEQKTCKSYRYKQEFIVQKDGNYFPMHECDNGDIVAYTQKSVPVYTDSFKEAVWTINRLAVKKSEPAVIVKPIISDSMRAYVACKKAQDEMGVIGLTLGEVWDIMNCDPKNMFRAFDHKIKKAHTATETVYIFR